jgi:hypothetical protein
MNNQMESPIDNAIYGRNRMKSGDYNKKWRDAVE